MTKNGKKVREREIKTEKRNKKIKVYKDTNRDKPKRKEKKIRAAKRFKKHSNKRG